MAPPPPEGEEEDLEQPSFYCHVRLISNAGWRIIAAVITPHSLWTTAPCRLYMHSSTVAQESVTFGTCRTSQIPTVTSPCLVFGITACASNLFVLAIFFFSMSVYVLMLFGLFSNTYLSKDNRWRLAFGCSLPCLDASVHRRCALPIVNKWIQRHREQCLRYLLSK